MGDIDELTPLDLVPGLYLELQEPTPAGFPDPLPPLDLGDGPHRSYAIQWFAFATLTAVGWVVLVRRRASSAGQPRRSADSSAAAR